MGSFQTYPSSTTAELSDYCKKKQPVNHEEKKGYLTRNIRTRFLRKELRNLMNNQNYSRKIYDNSEDKILSITNDFKRYKITHLTRPNKLGTTTGKVAKRNPKTRF